MQVEAVLIEEHPKPKGEPVLRGLIMLLLGCSVFAVPALVMDRHNRAKSGQ
jgi:hypothetical protein